MIKAWVVLWAAHPRAAIEAMREARRSMRAPNFQVRNPKTGERIDLRNVLSKELRQHERVTQRERFLAGGLRMEGLR